MYRLYTYIRSTHPDPDERKEGRGVRSTEAGLHVARGRELISCGEMGIE